MAERRLASIRTVRQFLERYQRHLSSLGIISGFIVDVFTFTRIDVLTTQLLLVTYLILVALGIIAINLYEAGKMRHMSEESYLWLLIVIQFCFGGLFGRFLIYYSRSSSIYTSWPFLSILTLLLVANEYAKKYYTRLTLQMSFFFIALFSFFILLVPLLFGQISDWTFIIAGAISVAIMLVYIYVVAQLIPVKVWNNKERMFGTIGLIFFIINVFYFTNVIPPIPLALQEGDVYHSVAHVGNEYRVIGEPKEWYSFLTQYPKIHLTENEPAYIYSAIFAPASFGIDVVHNWQYYDEKTNSWSSVSKIHFPIVGGQDGGYRGYSTKANLSPGYWRVDVETPRGQVLGRVQFVVVRVRTTFSPLVSATK